MITVANDFDLTPRNTFRIRSEAATWIEFTHCDDIPRVAEMLHGISASSPGIVIGEGSDLLFTSSRIDSPIAHSSILSIEMTPVGSGRVRVTAGSGLRMDTLVEHTASSGLWGMENLSLIPGEVGASAVQNVGAYGCEASDIIERVYAYDIVERRHVKLRGSECRFAYRHSLFKTSEAKGRYIISAVTFMLSSEARPRLEYGNLAEKLGDTSRLTPMDVRRAVAEIRRAKLPDPAETGSAGSYFTNPIVDRETYAMVERRTREMHGAEATVPCYTMEDGRVKIPAAWLIDKAGLKGSAVGDAALWPGQPLVIANMSGSCTASEVLALERHVVNTVKKHFGITLTPEVEKMPPII
ncbi:MAG: UDP-N-acetylmuramate dehydrogenase [Pseudoflavonifractor sp.]|nr:UDP-N-acetylmuramate dehydrogenase [Pseudoflavonifractor sp.]